MGEQIKTCIQTVKIMKRLHVMLKVNNLQESIEFYNTLFGTVPTTLKEDYAKWFVEDPKVNFSIAERPGEKGIEHLGIQAESESELAEVRENRPCIKRNFKA